MPVRTKDELRARVEADAASLADASADDVLEWTANTFGERWIVASNMQDAVLVDLAVRHRPTVDVLFLDTGYHFPETIGTRDAVAAVYPGIRLVNAVPARTVAEQDAELGPALHDRDPDRCCALRKVAPLRAVLSGYEAWVTGMRRVDATTRSAIPVVSWDQGNGLVKVNPIAAWSDDQFEDYVDRYGVLRNPLVGEGYPSIGCAPCTARPAPGADPRSGRWSGRGKTECGLHT
ncbi:phosphoadenylyl-sulfate reductase [Actinoalloteichus caeruleus]|uniref:phosphoadenylyl-sulfate reductase n=1 Tax=Actinoalloteichus cyanogriseus TaxID=2893586 RepID=UPI0004AA3F1E|nr:phosphoadenylyl-sulfate reductase [Actinoalloteichus caeruleus]